MSAKADLEFLDLEIMRFFVEKLDSRTGISADCFSKQAGILFLLTALLIALPTRAAELVETPRSIEHRNSLSVLETLRWLRGRIVSAPSSKSDGQNHTTSQDRQPQWAFRMADGKTYRVLRTQLSESIFLDGRLREKELILKALPVERDSAIEVRVIHSMKEGVEHELYYYCDICSIKSASPEICACCREPVRLVEKPITDKSEVSP
ncbi:MAG: hypothetical protein EXS31_07240 [Pedosphaera sp.]|nr:hypothetical protein [Pedosphaera sp.]